MESSRPVGHGVYIGLRLYISFGDYGFEASHGSCGTLNPEPPFVLAFRV